MLLELLQPFSFLTIKHESGNPRTVNWIAPLVIAAVILGIGASAENPIDVFGVNGMLSRLLGFAQSLPGFYIAALAAIATFNNRDMLKLMPGVPPEGTIYYGGHKQRVKMTRRRFLSSMFAYLTALSIGLTLLAIALLTIAEPVKSLLPVTWLPFAKAGVTYFFMVFLCQMVTITLWGLYYLGDRLHTPDALDPNPVDAQNTQP